MHIQPLNAALQRALLMPVTRIVAVEAVVSATTAPVAHAAETPPAVHGAAPSVEMLVALAAAVPERERRRRVAAQADSGLGQLEKLHQELLAGRVTRERLHGLAEWAKSRERPDDSDLARLSEEIELRILVELAKRERG